MVEMENEILDILFVAEDEALAEMYKQKLELDGYRVRVVSRQQTRSIGRPLPSLVYLDIKTVDLKTPRFLSDLRSNSLTKDLPVVVLTEYREEELRERGVRLGARDYLVRVPSPRSAAQRIRPGNLVEAISTANRSNR
jgi:two-component system, OmpR family, phosphate regulon response regulator PhoB